MKVQYLRSLLLDLLENVFFSKIIIPVSHAFVLLLSENNSFSISHNMVPYLHAFNVGTLNFVETEYCLVHYVVTWF